MLYLDVGERVQHHVYRGQDEGKRMAFSPEQQPHGVCRPSCGEIEPEGRGRAKPHHDGALAGVAVGVAVAEVVHQQQGVDHRATSHRGDDDGPRQRVKLDIVGRAYGHYAEEHQHEDIAETHIRKTRRVEKTEHHADDAYQYHLQAAVDD